MDHGVELALAEDFPQLLLVPHVIGVEGHVFPAELLDPVHHQSLAVAQVVHNGHLVSLLQQNDGGVAADIPGAASD